MFSPYLSVVAASRNDDHGGDPLIRTQVFINNIARQCEKYRLPAELIIVDWNPVPDRPGLACVLSVPPEITCLQARVITVPTALHRRFKYSEGMPLFQMIAKNVGIRRAKAPFILTTNIDILFSDELIQFIALQHLDPKKLYRVDRYDIENGLSRDASHEEVMSYSWSHVIRAHHRYQPTSLVHHLYEDAILKRACNPQLEFRGRVDGVEVVHEDGIWQIRPERSVPMSYLHTNGCGDFTLLSREGWEAIGGYAEITGYSFNIDSMGLIAAHYSGYQEVSLLLPCVCFHIEHGIGSGWTPEGENALFDRLRAAGVLNPSWPVLMPLVDEMRAQGKALQINHSGWGLVDFELPEQAMGDTSKIPEDRLAKLAKQAETRNIAAIQPAYDLDRLTLAHERRIAATSRGSHATATLNRQPDAASNPGSIVAVSTERVVLYIPDSNGDYSEDRSIAYNAHLSSTTTLVFRLDKFAHQFRLRFDPCQCRGLIKINSIIAFDILTNRAVWHLDGRDTNKIVITGTTAWLNSTSRKRGWSWFMQTSQRPLCLISTGLDPQLILPPLPHNIKFPLIISVDMKVTPSG